MTSPEIVEAIELVPTLLELAAAPPMPHLQGKSLVPYLKALAFEAKPAALMKFTEWKEFELATSAICFTPMTENTSGM